MRKFNLALLMLCIITSILAQDKPAYILYNAKGKKISFGKMVDKISGNDIILFGELHNNAIAHWLQLELVKDAKEKRGLVLGAEMFEQDNQEALDHYLHGDIDQKGFDTLANRLCTISKLCKRK